MEKPEYLRAILVLAILAWIALPIAATPTSPIPWHITGTLTESCTCDVPCTCNFGGEPSPHSFCYAVIVSTIEKGHYGTTRLDGLMFGAGAGSKGAVFYLDDHATPEQIAAMKVIATHMHDKMVGYYKSLDPKLVEDPAFKLLDFKQTHMVQKITPKGNHVELGTIGGFDVDSLIGMDGKSPIKLLNNFSFNITDNVKGRASRLFYKDEFGNAFDMSKRNANQGKFDWTDQTEIYFR